MSSPPPSDNVQSILDAYSDIDGDVYQSGAARIIGVEQYADVPNAIAVTTERLTEDGPTVIVNPPTYVVNDDGTTRFAPLEAIADVITRHGG